MFEDAHLEFEYESRNGSDVDTVDDDDRTLCFDCGYEWDEYGECDCDD